MSFDLDDSPAQRVIKISAVPDESDYKQQWELIGKTDPSLQAALMPRRYVANHNYHSPLTVAVHLFRSLADCVADNGATNQSAYMTIAGLMREGMPTYFISPSLLDAALGTTIPPTLRMHDIAWPRAALLFILPRNQLGIDGTEVRAVGISHNPSHPALSVRPNFPSLSNGDENISWAISSGNRTFQGRFDYHLAPSLADKLNEWGKGDYGEWDPIKSKSLSERGHALAGLAMKLLLLMSAKHKALLTPSVCLRPATQKRGKSKSKDALWTPNILGRDYQMRSSPPGRTDNGETGAPKRLHFVRGHFRQQPYGRRAQPRYETIWIEPFLSGKA